MNYYLLLVEGGVDCDVRGPYPRAADRDQSAREIVRGGDFSADYDSIFRLDLDGNVPSTYSFGHGELAGRFL